MVTAGSVTRVLLQLLLWLRLTHQRAQRPVVLAYIAALFTLPVLWRA
jgi:hypothetical protein